MEFLPKPEEMNFNAPNLAATWKKWKQTMTFYLTAMMKDKSEEERYSAFLFMIGEQGREIFNTMEWEKIQDADGNPTEGDNITINELFKKFDEYCEPRKNLVVERRKFFWRNQLEDEHFDQYLTVLKNLASTCEFGELHDGLLTYKIIDGIQSDKIRNTLLRKGAGMTLEKAVEINRIEEVTRRQMLLLKNEKDVDYINKRSWKQSSKATKSETKKDKDEKVSTRNIQNKKCSYCGKQHKPRSCPAYGQICRKCKKKNHWASCCRSKSINEATKENYDDDDFLIEQVTIDERRQQERNKQTEAFAVIRMNGKRVTAKLDTGAEVNVMPLRVFNQIADEETELKTTKVKLNGYSGEDIPVKGTVKLRCKFKEIDLLIIFYIVESNSKTVISLQTCKDLGIIKILNEVMKCGKTKYNDLKAQENELFKAKVTKIKGMQGSELKNTIQKMYPEVFKNLGKIEPAHHIRLKETVQPVIHPPRKIPASMRSAVKEELSKMEKTGVIKRIEEPTEWVNSMVVVEKPAGGLRICLDPRDLNKAIQREHYQLPTFDEISSRLTGSTLFSKLDANKGYWQIPLDEDSMKLTTFNTPFGRYQFTRLPYGIHSAQEVFHKRISQTFEDMGQIETDIDDILVWGKKEDDHDIHLIKCLEKAKAMGMTMNIDKCQFKTSELIYLGHKLTVEGIQADESKIKSILDMPIPEDKKAVQRLLGMLNYVGKFVPKLSELTSPLRELLVKNKQWEWKQRHNIAFERIKEILLSKHCLSFFDVTKPVSIYVDASGSGLGAVLTQNNKPIAYASRALTETQKRYAPIEQELLAVVLGCHKFHQYIYGKQVTVYSDHKPLENIIKKPFHVTPPRLQRMLLNLQKYDINLLYLSGKEHVLADTMSRAHLQETAEEIAEKELNAQIHMIKENAAATQQKLEEIQHEVQKDTIMLILVEYINSGWPKKRNGLQEKLKCYWSFREELSVIDGIIYKGEIIVIPSSMRKGILKQLHKSHLGVERQSGEPYLQYIGRK